MTIEKEPLTTPIAEGRARILLKLGIIECETENNAPDFITIENDKVYLKIDMPDADIRIDEFEKEYPVTFLRSNDGKTFFEFDGESIWFDINIDQVKDVWVADLSFRLLSNNSRYLAYYIKKLDHQFEWLQPDMKSGEIKSMSITTKKFKPPKITGKEVFSATEVLRCADMVSRSIKKIDLRVGGAYVKFNTDKGRLEPLIIGMADRLG